MGTKVFLCHASGDAEFVCQVASHLSRHVEVFYYEAHQRADSSFHTGINKALEHSTAYVVFWGATSGQATYQHQEIAAITDYSARARSVVLVALDGSVDSAGLPAEHFAQIRTRQFVPATEIRPVECAERIVTCLDLVWKPHGLPSNPHLFSYEKYIIDFFAVKRDLGSTLFEQAEDPKEERERDQMRRMLRDGCPPEWPDVVDLSKQMQIKKRKRKNRLKPQDIGSFRGREERVAAAALNRYAKVCLDFSFPEAGPREQLVYPMHRDRPLNVGILVSGGIAPGINAVVDGIVQRHWMYAGPEQERHQLFIRGYRDGFYALKAGVNNHHFPLAPDPSYRINEPAPRYTSAFASTGGSILGTSRNEDLLNPDTRDNALRDINDRLRTQAIDLLYVIGGDGSMKAAHALWNVARADPQRREPLSIVAIPKTMDNDILWVWQSFGFLSAVEKARETIDLLHTEVSSNPRICVLQLFGSDSGFVVSHAVVASSAGHCDVALIPEVPFSMLGLARYLRTKICRRPRLIPNSLIVMAETAIPVDVMCYLEPGREYARRLRGLSPEERRVVLNFDPEGLGLSFDERRALENFEQLRGSGKRIEGQTSDDLRRAGLKVVTRVLPKLLPVARTAETRDLNWKSTRIFANEPRHLLRAIAPSTADIIMGQRLGSLAVDNAMAGYTDFMISQWLTEFVLVPLELAVLGRKRIPQRGIFWKSVLAQTGQPPDLAAPWGDSVNTRRRGSPRAAEGECEAVE